jgi:ActR/RegA family two-component response regulator
LYFQQAYPSFDPSVHAFWPACKALTGAFLPVLAFDESPDMRLSFRVHGAKRRRVWPCLFAESGVTEKGIWSLVIALDMPVFFRVRASQLYEVTLPVLRHRLLLQWRYVRRSISGCMMFMSTAETHCVLLANAHHGLSEGVRGLLSTALKAVVMVADEVSLFESARRLQSELAVVDLALARGNALDLVRRLRSDFPTMRVIVVGVHDGPSVSRLVLAAGADGYVVKRAIATDLLLATDAVLDGKQYVSPDVGESHY